LQNWRFYKFAKIVLKLIPKLLSIFLKIKKSRTKGSFQNQGLDDTSLLIKKIVDQWSKPIILIIKNH